MKNHAIRVYNMKYIILLQSKILHDIIQNSYEDDYNIDDYNIDDYNEHCSQ